MAHTNRLRELRVASGLSLKDAAEQLGLGENGKSLLSRYERGEVQIPDARKAQFALFYGVSREWLMGWEDDANGAAQEQEAC